MFGHIKTGKGSTITIINDSDQPMVLGDIETSGDGTRITYVTSGKNARNAVFGSIKNTGDDCVLVQVHGGQRTVTSIEANTIVTTSSAGTSVTHIGGETDHSAERTNSAS